MLHNPPPTINIMCAGLEFFNDIYLISHNYNHIGFTKSLMTIIDNIITTIDNQIKNTGSYGKLLFKQVYYFIYLSSLKRVFITDYTGRSIKSKTKGQQDLAIIASNSYQTIRLK